MWPTLLTSYDQGAHFPDHMKFHVTFPVEASKDYPWYRVFTDMVNSRDFILTKNTVRPDSQ